VKSSVLLLGWLACWAGSASAAPSDFFAIRVVDEATGRGVPLVQLTTVHKVSHWTDSNGWIAFLEPGLMDQEVFFHVRADGYEFPRDGFGHRGLRLTPRAGQWTQVRIKRTNIAERLYRLTGAGIYRDSVLLGQPTPLREPLLSGQVLGQDTVIATPYRGKIYWFWGDTDRASYPLGNFGASGATSPPPGQPGADPLRGIDFTYFVGADGFSKPICPDFGPGLQWIESVLTIKHDGEEKLVARVASVPGLAKPHDWHVAVFNDEKETFESVVRWEIDEPHDSAHPFRASVNGQEYFYLYPNYRVPARLGSLTNLSEYEALTCLTGATNVLRDPQGSIRYEWRQGEPRLHSGRVRRLIHSGLVQTNEVWKRPLDVRTGAAVDLPRGSVAWNAFRQRWVMIASGRPGEVWFSEADTPTGPWVYARQVVGHENYNFYNPVHHSFFDQEAGRIIYFEGTYTDSFSGAKAKTPRYDYNQIMYRLELDHPQLTLPAPVYAVTQGSHGLTWMMRPQLVQAQATDRIASVPFFALPPEPDSRSIVSIFLIQTNGHTALRATGEGKPLFSAPSLETAVPARDKAAEQTPLYEYRHRATGRHVYSVEPELSEEFARSPAPLCLVWRNPLACLPLDWSAQPVK
jgi:hypothetical protein